MNITALAGLAMLGGALASNMPKRMGKNKRGGRFTPEEFDAFVQKYWMQDVYGDGGPPEALVTAMMDYQYFWRAVLKDDRFGAENKELAKHVLKHTSEEMDRMVNWGDDIRALRSREGLPNPSYFDGLTVPMTRGGRRRMASRCSTNKCFGDPKQLKYPLCSKYASTCGVSCDATKAAWARARQHKAPIAVQKRILRSAKRGGCGFVTRGKAGEAARRWKLR